MVKEYSGENVHLDIARGVYRRFLKKERGRLLETLSDHANSEAAGEDWVTQKIFEYRMKTGYKKHNVPEDKLRILFTAYRQAVNEGRNVPLERFAELTNYRWPCSPGSILKKVGLKPIGY